MSVETALYTVLAAAIAAAEEGDALFEVQLCSTVYDVPTKPHAIRIGDTNCDLAPGPGGPVEEWDILGTVEILARADQDTPEVVAAAREKVRLMELAVAQVLFDDTTLGDEINDCRILGGLRGWGNIKNARHAVAHLHLIANETGAQ